LNWIFCLNSFIFTRTKLCSEVGYQSCRFESLPARKSDCIYYWTHVSEVSQLLQINSTSQAELLRVRCIGRHKDKSLIPQNLSSSVKFSLFDFCKIVEENIENISTAFRTSPRIYL